ncbi:hypothetical protein D3C72_1294930 [compost metagenome]
MRTCSRSGPGAAASTSPATVHSRQHMGVAGKRFRRCAGGSGAQCVVSRTRKARTQEASAVRGAIKRVRGVGAAGMATIVPAIFGRARCRIRSRRAPASALESSHRSHDNRSFPCRHSTTPQHPPPRCARSASCRGHSPCPSSATPCKCGCRASTATWKAGYAAMDLSCVPGSAALWYWWWPTARRWPPCCATAPMVSAAPSAATSSRRKWAAIPASSWPKAASGATSAAW